VARGLWALPAPAADHPDHAALRVVSSLLAGGRASRLHRILVEEKELALSISADVHETEAPGVFTLGVELMPDGEPEAVEAILLEELARLRAEAPRADELERARRILLADWVFGHEKVHQQALAIGVSSALFGEDHSNRQLERVAAVTADQVVEVTARYLDPERGSTLGWALPEEDAAEVGG
jgi:zinc protease